jgi:hypothetical protein
MCLPLPAAGLGARDDGRGEGHRAEHPSGVGEGHELAPVTMSTHVVPVALQGPRGVDVLADHRERPPRGIPRHVLDSSYSRPPGDRRVTWSRPR